MPALAARPAVFDASAQQRRVLIAKVKLAQKELGLVEDDYRAMLVRVTGRLSAADCSIPELTRMVEEMKSKGFKLKRAAGKSRSVPRPADHPSARKARALWISLHQLGVIDNPSEPALEAFAARQLGVARLQWADQALTYKLVEALKSIATRNGWSQDLARVSPAAAVPTLKRRLCEAILVKLQETGLAGADWSLDQAAFRLLGMEGPLGIDGRTRIGTMFWDIGQIDALAQGLGAKLRQGRGT